MKIALKDIVPHKPPMLLLDKIVKQHDNVIICETKISEHSIFYDNNINGIYAWVGIEFMAQAIAAYAGILHYPAEPELGLLLSVRKFVTEKTCFSVGEILTIRAEKEYMHDSVGVFNGAIIIEGEQVASARLNTIVPPQDKIDAILQGKKS